MENRVNFKLRYMLGGSDEEFYMRVREAVERRKRFESGIVIGEELASDSEKDDQPDMMSVSQVSDDLEIHSEH